MNMLFGYIFQTFYFPSDAGLAVEGGDANDFYMLQIHYNNPTHKDGN